METKKRHPSIGFHPRGAPRSYINHSSACGHAASRLEQGSGQGKANQLRK